jgi:photosystem II oxygen-evolving enhancer protein 1
MRYRALIVAFFALCLSLVTACSNDVSSSSSGRNLLTYDEIRGTGLANKCPQLTEANRDAILIDTKQSYAIQELCLEPTNFFVKEEPANKRQTAEFVAGKLLTRNTYSIDQVQGELKINSDNSITFKEADGLDFQAITVQLPGGERVPFLFTVKNLVANSRPDQSSITTSTDFTGTFKVPSYRGAAFLDPKGRGVVTGYDNAVALPAQADDEELTRTNVKRAEISQGKISLKVARIDSKSGEIAGTFESEQPSDTDLGAGEPKEVKIRGIFHGRVVASNPA